MTEAGQGRERPVRDAGARRAAHAWGHAAEGIALLWLILKGYRPLARRFSAQGGEVDLVMRRGGTIVFVEVKARANTAAAFEAIDGVKRRRFARAARAWLVRHPWAAGLTLRADAVLVVPGRLPRHLPAAFEIEIG